jgi:hypothetical protein
MPTACGRSALASGGEVTQAQARSPCPEREIAAEFCCVNGTPDALGFSLVLVFSRVSPEQEERSHDSA